MANVGKSTLGRKSAHREALLIQGSNALIKHKNIFTSKVKAKMIARYLAPIITKARKHVDTDFLHAKRQAFSSLKDKKGVQTLFNEILPRVADRPGGYTRIITLSSRPGDDKTRVLLELVDYNMLYKRGSKAKTTRRSRRKSKGSLGELPTTPAATKEKNTVAPAPKKEEKIVAETPAKKAETTPKKKEEHTKSANNNNDKSS